MDTLLQTMGFKDVEHFKSSTEAYPDCLSQATIEILTKYKDVPILLLEDDVEFTGEDDVTIGADVDAVYLGLSIFGAHPTTGALVRAPYSETQFRVLNMLSTHAILYITPKYKQAVIDTLQENMGHMYFNDVLISRLQSKFFVVANRRPSFYQAARWGGNQDATYIEFTD